MEVPSVRSLDIHNIQQYREFTTIVAVITIPVLGMAVLTTKQHSFNHSYRREHTHQLTAFGATRCNAVEPISIFYLLFNGQF
jgi:hypothetical protein